MASNIIGACRAGRSNRSVEVAWNPPPGDRRVYVGWAGWTEVGKAESARDAMRKAEAWLYDK